VCLRAIAVARVSVTRQQGTYEILEAEAHCLKTELNLDTRFFFFGWLASAHLGGSTRLGLAFNKVGAGVWQFSGTL
jgi:hypothetical protein